MMPTTMDIGRWALASAEADVQLAVAEESSHEAVASELSGPDTSWTLARFQERFGSQWVAGRVVVSSEALEFRPRDQVNTVPLALRLGQVTSIEPIATIFNKGLRVKLSTGETLTFRCRAASEIVESLQSAAGAARAAAA